MPDRGARRNTRPVRVRLDTAPRVGTAGWSLPRAEKPHFPAEGTNLERYAARLDAAEINSSFYRPHRPSTYARWAASVPAHFRFAVKVPKAITHERRLAGAEPHLDAFLAEAFLVALRERHAGPVAVEPRHPTWLDAEAEALLAAHRVARVAADPARAEVDASPGGWDGLRYYRLHGSPRIYYSAYDDEYLRSLAVRLGAAAAAPAWCIFDNTASGAATANALALRARLARSSR
jgi:uncharacterized protein YecE (DUF72 family)